MNFLNSSSRGFFTFLAGRKEGARRPRPRGRRGRGGRGGRGEAEEATSRGRFDRSVRASQKPNPARVRHSATPPRVSTPLHSCGMTASTPEPPAGTLLDALRTHALKGSPAVQSLRAKLGDTDRDEQRDRRTLLATAEGVHAVFKSLRTVRPPPPPRVSSAPYPRAPLRFAPPDHTRVHFIPAGASGPRPRRLRPPREPSPSAQGGLQVRPSGFPAQPPFERRRFYSRLIPL